MTQRTSRKAQDPSQSSAAALAGMRQINQDDLYADFRNASRLLGGILKYLENGKYQLPHTGEFTSDFTENREGLRKALLQLQKKALEQFDDAQNRLDHPSGRQSTMEVANLERRKAALLRLSDVASSIINQFDSAERPIRMSAVPTVVEGPPAPTRLGGITSAEREEIPHKTPSYRAQTKATTVGGVNYDISVSLPSEMATLGSAEIVPGTGMTRGQVLCGNLESMVRASLMGTTESRSKAGKEFWENVLGFAGSEARARQAVCGSSVSGDACTRLVNNIKNGNYDLEYLRSGVTPLSELVVNALENSTETVSNVTFYFSAEARKEIKEWERARLDVGAHASVTGTRTTSTTREGGQVTGVTTSETARLGAGADVGLEVDVTQRSQVGVVAGVDFFQSIVGGDPRYTIPGKIYYKFQKGTTTETGLQGELFGRIEYGSLPKEEYERLKTELGGALVFIFAETGSTNFGVVTTMNAFKLRETEGGFEYVLRSVDLGLGPEVAFSLREGSDARIMIVPKGLLRFESVGEDGQYQPRGGVGLDAVLSKGKVNGAVSLEVSQPTEIPGTSASGAPYIGLNLRITW